MSHTPPTSLTTLITSTSHALDKHLNHVYHPYTHSSHPHLPRTTTPALPSSSYFNIFAADTHATQTTVHASQSPQQPHPQHRVTQQPHRQTNDYHSTTNTTQAHIPSSKTEINLMIPQVNINGIKTNSRSSDCLFTTHMNISSHFRKPSSPLKSNHAKYITSQQCATIGCTRQERGSSHSLETT